MPKKVGIHNEDIERIVGAITSARMREVMKEHVHTLAELTYLIQRKDLWRTHRMQLMFASFALDAAAYSRSAKSAPNPKVIDALRQYIRVAWGEAWPTYSTYFWGRARQYPPPSRSLSSESPSMQKRALETLMRHRAREALLRLRDRMERRRVLSKSAMRKALTNWTGSMYREVQNARRDNYDQRWPELRLVVDKKPFDFVDQGNALHLNSAIGRFMHRFALRAPATPPGWERPRYLYRGVHGPIAANLEGHAKVDEKGYIPFTRDLGTAMKFAEEESGEGFVLRLRVDEVPHRTPWIWFQNPGPRRGKVRSQIEEGEVLLPPGRLQFKKRAEGGYMFNGGSMKTSRGLIPVGMYDVRYSPDQSATTLLDRDAIVPRPSRNDRNDTTPNTSHMWNLFNKPSVEKTRRKKAKASL